MMSIAVRQSSILPRKLALFLQLCELDLRQRTAGSAFGTLWLYVNPTVSIAIIWFVFHFGLRSASGAREISSLLIGLMGWQLITDCILNGIGAFTEKPYLIKKIKFPFIFLPLIKIFNSARIHLPFLILVIFLSVMENQFTWMGISSFCLLWPVILLFLTGIVLILSTVSVFLRDLPDLIRIGIQILFWATPIIWVPPDSPAIIGQVEAFNPFFVIVQIYRSCFLPGEHNVEPSTVVAFLVATVALNYIGVRGFQSLSKHFADVL